ncbi:SET domain-containing protein-lysine N-methyltransferase [Bradyrhizobium yuanmingense]|uniref:SET domain-containing protein-lysine N-methyltransferase n=1 Tax=Bradyrhizobium yuanmingense TaxID=108015 RepID=UPI0035138C3A
MGYPRDYKANDDAIEYNADNARFMNNSSQPNTYQHHHRRLLTARQVQPDEELTYDCFSVHA